MPLLTLYVAYIENIYNLYRTHSSIRMKKKTGVHLLLSQKVVIHTTTDFQK